MTRLQDMIVRARRRHTLNRMLHDGGLGLSAGIAMAIVAILVDRLSPLALHLSWPVLGAIALVGLGVGVIRPLLRMPSAEDIALQVDRALHMQDRIASAHALQSPLNELHASHRTGPKHDDAFSTLVQHQAESMAGRIDLRSVAPIRITSVWGAAVSLLVAIVLLFLFVPNVSWGDPTSQGIAAHAEESQEEIERREREREALLETISQTVSDVADDAVLDERVQRELEALDRLSQQLQQGVADDEQMTQARDEAAARLNELSEQLSERAEREQQAAEKLAERFNRMQTPEVPMSAEQFDEALRRGDFGRAADSLDELLARSESLDQQERESLAEHLQQLMDELDDASNQSQQDLLERAAQLEQALRDQGLDQQAIEQLLQDIPASQQELMRQLLEDGIDEDIARRLARELDQLRQQRELEEQLQRDSDAIRDALRDAADVLDRHEPKTPDPDPETVTETEADETSGDDTDRQQQPDTTEDRAADPDGESDQPDASDSDTESDTDRQQREGEEATAAEDPDQQQERLVDSDADEQAVSEAQQEQAEGDQATEEGAVEDESGDGESVGEQTDDAGAEDEGGTAGSDDSQQQASEQAGDEGGEGGQSPTQLQDEAGEPAELADEEAQQPKSPSDSLRELQQRREQADQRRQSSERMREQARRMADRTPPTDDTPDREGMRAEHSDGAGDSSPQPREGDAAPDREARDVDDVDLRESESEDPGELIAEWLSDEAQPGEPQTRRVEAERRVRQAQQIAERAVEESAVPSRYHDLIRRYFGRLNETVDRASDSGQE